MLYWIRLRLNRLLHTEWRNYFSSNGERTWKYIDFMGPAEAPGNSRVIVGFWRGVDSAGRMYSMGVALDQDSQLLSRRDPSEAARNLWEIKKKSSRELIERFLLPECRCRVGYHWRCPIHWTWNG